MKNIIISVNEQGVALLELNRPEALNALNRELMEEVRASLQTWAVDDTVKALILTGRGRALCAGADLGAAAQQSTEPALSTGEMVAQGMKTQFNPTMAAIYNFPKPVVIAINGMAAGGGVGIALCGDIILASEKAKLKVVQIQQLGIAADLGANWLLQRVVGRTRAMAMCLAGDTVPAETLLQWGAVLEVLPPEKLLARAYEYAGKLAAVPNEAVLATRRLIDEAPQRSFEQSIEDERLIQRELCDNPFFMNQVKSFMGLS